MENLFENWKRFVNEESEYQDEYTSTFHLRLSNDIGGGYEETIRFIRAIPQVTQVQRDKEIYDSDSANVSKYFVKFVLKSGGDSKTYIQATLKPGIRKINGLSIIKYLGTEKVR